MAQRRTFSSRSPRVSMRTSTALLPNGPSPSAVAARRRSRGLPSRNCFDHPARLLPWNVGSAAETGRASSGSRAARHSNDRGLRRVMADDHNTRWMPPGSIIPRQQEQGFMAQTIRCPECDKPNPDTADRCEACGAPLDEEEQDLPRARPRRRSTGDEVAGAIVPLNVSPWALLSCYLGLVGFCLPFIGLVFAVPALIFGIIALRKPEKGGSYGAVTSNIRAIIGVVLSSLAIVGYGALLIWLVFIDKRP